MDTDKLDAFGRYKDSKDAPASSIPAKGETYDIGGIKTDAQGHKVADEPAKKTRAKAEAKTE